MICTALNEYVVTKQLGSGTVGEVFLAEKEGQLFAVKVLDEELCQEESFLEQVAQLIEASGHPRFVRIVDSFIAQGKRCLVMDPLLDEEEKPCHVRAYIHKQKAPLSEEVILHFAKQIAEGLDSLHLKGKAHGGLTLSNIFICEEELLPRVLLSDVGLSLALGNKKMRACTFSALSHYFLEPATFSNPKERAFMHHYPFLSPEFPEDPIKADLYAFGVVLYYLFFRTFPKGHFPLPSQAFPYLKYAWDELISSCLSCNIEQRPKNLSSSLSSLASTPHLARPHLKPQELIRPSFEPDPGAVFQIDTTIGRYLPKEEKPKEICPLMTEMVIISGGTFLRGSAQGGRDEMPRHAVQLASFALDIHPVTNEQFVLFLEAMGGEKDAQNNDIIRLRDARIKRAGGKLSIESGYAKHPVVGVTWYGAVAYAKWVGKRLPTEAEWEVAAYGGNEECIYPSGMEIDRSYANFFSSDTTPVMSYPSNPFGLFDMAGNVYEWCLDWYDYHYYNVSIQEPAYPKGPLQGVYRVLRGGCWKSLKEDLRCAHRHRNNPGTVNSTYGFRCAADVIIN